MKLNVTEMIYDRMVQNAREAGRREGGKREEHWYSYENRMVDHDPPIQRKPDDDCSVWHTIVGLSIIFLVPVAIFLSIAWLCGLIGERTERTEGEQPPIEVEK